MPWRKLLMAVQIEMAALASDDELLHGEAVNIDMALTTHVRPCHYGDQVVVLSESYS